MAGPSSAMRNSVARTSCSGLSATTCSMSNASSADSVTPRPAARAAKRAFVSLEVRVPTTAVRFALAMVNDGTLTMSDASLSCPQSQTRPQRSTCRTSTSLLTALSLEALNGQIWDPFGMPNNDDPPERMRTFSRCLEAAHLDVFGTPNTVCVSRPGSRCGVDCCRRVRHAEHRRRRNFIGLRHASRVRFAASIRS